MVALERTKVFLFPMLVLQLKVTVQSLHLFTVTAGVDVDLPCGKRAMEDQERCSSAAWFFRQSADTVPLFEHGHVVAAAGRESNALSVSPDCSLTVKVTAKDAGFYTCRQKHSKDAEYHLSVVGSEDTKTAAPTMTSTSSREAETTEAPTTASTSTGGRRTAAGTNSTAAAHQGPTAQHARWWFPIVAVGSAALLTAAAVLFRRKEGDKPRTDGSTADPEGGVSYASISYIKTTSSSSSSSQVLGKAAAAADEDDDDDDEEVTYTTVRISDLTED